VHSPLSNLLLAVRCPCQVVLGSNSRWLEARIELHPLVARSLRNVQQDGPRAQVQGSVRHCMLVVLNGSLLKLFLSHLCHAGS
jgi:hypothetical protein